MSRYERMEGLLEDCIAVQPSAYMPLPKKVKTSSTVSVVQSVAELQEQKRARDAAIAADHEMALLLSASSKWKQPVSSSLSSLSGPERPRAPPPARGVAATSLSSTNWTEDPHLAGGMFLDQAEDAMVLLQDNPEQLRQGLIEEELVVHRGGPETLATTTIRKPNLENAENRILDPGHLAVTAPKPLIPPQHAKKLLADEDLVPNVRAGWLQTNGACLTWEETVTKLAGSAAVPGTEKHPATEGDSSEEEVELAETMEKEIAAGTFLPQSGAKLIPASVEAYKTRFFKMCKTLLKRCGMSWKRRAVSRASVELFGHALRLCTDFSQSRAQYFSHVKGYIEIHQVLSEEQKRAYDKHFKTLHDTKQQTRQQVGFRGSDMCILSNKIGGSTKNREELVMIVDHEGERTYINAETAFRFMICCWFCCLRPDDSGHTSRRTLPGGDAVEYTIHSSKRDQEGVVQAQVIFDCNCRTAPTCCIPLCPVCALHDDDWSIMQRAMKKVSIARQRKKKEEKNLFESLGVPDEEEKQDDDESKHVPAAEPKWSEAIRKMLEMAGIPNPRVGEDLKKGRMGRYLYGPYAVRIGGAQSMRDGGSPEDEIQALGRWRHSRTKEHYKGLASLLCDRVRIPWPVRRGTLYDGSSNFNTAADWARVMQVQNNTGLLHAVGDGGPDEFEEWLDENSCGIREPRRLVKRGRSEADGPFTDDLDVFAESEGAKRQCANSSSSCSSGALFR